MNDAKPEIARPGPKPRSMTRTRALAGLGATDVSFYHARSVIGPIAQ